MFISFLVLFIIPIVAQSRCPLAGYDGFTAEIIMVSHQARGIVQISEHDCSFLVVKFDVVGFGDMSWWAAEYLELESILNGVPLLSDASLQNDLINATQKVFIPSTSWDALSNMKTIALWIPSEARLVGYVELGGSVAKSPSMFDHCVKYAENAQIRWNIVIEEETPELSYAEFAYEGTIAENIYQSIGFPLPKDNIMGGADSITYGIIHGQPFALDFFFPTYGECRETGPGSYAGVCSDIQLGKGRDMYDNVNMTYSQQVEGTWLITAQRLLNSTDKRFDLDINPFQPMQLLWAFAGFSVSQQQQLPMLEYHSSSFGSKNVTLIDGTVWDDSSECELIYDSNAISFGSTHLIQDAGSSSLSVTLGPKTSLNPLQPEQVIYIDGVPQPAIVVANGGEVIFDVQTDDFHFVVTDSPIGGSYAPSQNSYVQGSNQVVWMVDVPSNVTQLYYQSLQHPLVGGTILVDHSGDTKDDENLYDFSVSWDALNVEWSINGEDENRMITWNVEATKPAGWICIGFGSLMKGGYAYVAWMDEQDQGELAGYYMTGQGVSDVHLDPNAQILDAMVERDGITNRLRMSFQRKFTSQSEHEHNIAEGSMDMIWAYGNSWSKQTLSHSNIHSARGVQIVDLLSGTSNSKPVAAIWLAHGALMFVGWSLMVPFAVVIARYFKAQLGPMWMTIHKFSNMFGLLLSTVAAVLAVYEMQIAGAAHFSTYHTIMGFIVVLVGICQGVQGFIRPAKPGPDSKRIEHIKRNVWGIPHKFVGFCLLVVAHAAVITGLQAVELKGAGNTLKWQLAVYAWIAAIVVTAVTLQIKAILKTTPPATPSNQSPEPPTTGSSSDADSQEKKPHNLDSTCDVIVDMQLTPNS
eukprot:TRINITY_DN1809_c0_g1_i7.p1 TRINITY_DN1809_c0_g1~~TRINITY_DN1809_c0_g1_i7.p1  ORF type:complete len:864 (-),score=179.34 TRINITY_DN1809_c0_g1_i7:1688-4279(-)